MSGILLHITSSIFMCNASGLTPKHRFHLESLSEDSSEEVSSSSSDNAPPFLDFAHRDEVAADGPEDEEDYVDYEGQESYLSSEFKTPVVQRPFGLDISHMDKLQTFQVRDASGEPF
jgi:hypothetical protein